MPKTFSDSEREYIKQRLREEAKQCLTLYGVRKTTVDELVKRVKIPKGTFYLFYDSKELLFFDVFCAFHDEMQEKILSEIASVEGPMNVSQLTEFFFKFYKMVEESFMLQLMTNGNLELLIRKLPPEVAVKHAENDDINVEQLMALIPNMKSDNIPAFSAALRGVFLSMLHKHEIGEEIFDDALKILIRGVVIQMSEGVSL